jgi:hypothetical protein
MERLSFKIDLPSQNFKPEPQFVDDNFCGAKMVNVKIQKDLI